MSCIFAGDALIGAQAEYEDFIIISWPTNGGPWRMGYFQNMAQAVTFSLWPSSDQMPSHVGCQHVEVGQYSPRTDSSSSVILHTLALRVTWEQTSNDAVPGPVGTRMVSFHRNDIKSWKTIQPIVNCVLVAYDDST